MPASNDSVQAQKVRDLVLQFLFAFDFRFRRQLLMSGRVRRIALVGFREDVRILAFEFFRRIGKLNHGNRGILSATVIQTAAPIEAMT